MESYESAVRGDCGTVAWTIALRPSRVHRDSFDGVVVSIENKDVGQFVTIVVYQIVGVALEDHVSAIGGYVGKLRRAVSWFPTIALRYPLDRVIVSIVDEDMVGTKIIVTLRVARFEVRGARLKGDETAVTGD